MINRIKDQKGELHAYGLVIDLDFAILIAQEALRSTVSVRNYIFLQCLTNHAYLPQGNYTFLEPQSYMSRSPGAAREDKVALKLYKFQCSIC